jgi:hypothetical protein
MKTRAAQLAALVATLVVWGATAPAADKEQTAQRRAQLLAEMTSLAEKTQVAGESGTPLELVQKPVFRYDDQPRLFIDATMWIWTDEGRPVACQKIEARLHQDTNRPQWGYCFTSLAEGKLAVAWAGDRKYESTEPGIAFLPVPGAPQPAARPAERRRQAREIARRLSGRILINSRTSASAEMRLLTTPIYEYGAQAADLPAGAVFGFETNGTNPDLLVLVEVRDSAEKPTWQIAPARMTTGGITLNYDNEKIWEAPFVSPHDGPFANWLFFSTPRAPVPAEAAP